MDYPKISIITPSYNQGDYIEETINSVLEQGYPNLEYIVIDGASTDNSVEVIKKYEQSLTYWVSEKDSGQSEAINKGLKMATGEIINWINSDDIVIEGTFHKIADIFSSTDDNVGLIHGGAVMFDRKGVIAEDFGYDDPTLERYLSGIAFSQPAAYFRKEHLDKVGYLNEDRHYGMDYDLYSRLALVTDFIKVDELFARYRVHKASKTGSLYDNFIEEWIHIFIKVIHNIKADVIIKELKDLHVFDDYIHDVADYNFGFDPKEVDQQIMLFYFLCYVLKSDYKSGNFKRGRVVLDYLICNFQLEKIKDEKDVEIIVDRLESFPDGLIFMMRKFQKLIR